MDNLLLVEVLIVGKYRLSPQHRRHGITATGEGRNLIDGAAGHHQLHWPLQDARRCGAHQGGTQQQGQQQDGP